MFQALVFKCHLNTGHVRYLDSHCISVNGHICLDFSSDDEVWLYGETHHSKTTNDSSNNTSVTTTTTNGATPSNGNVQQNVVTYKKKTTSSTESVTPTHRVTLQADINENINDSEETFLDFDETSSVLPTKTVENLFLQQLKLK